MPHYWTEFMFNERLLLFFHAMYKSIEFEKGQMREDEKMHTSVENIIYICL
jgi:hypothetical protein